MFRVKKILKYQGINILLVQQENDEKIYVPRDCIRKALKYNNSGQLAKMQLRYDKIFSTEYIRYFVVEGSEGDIFNSGTGLYTIRGIIEICSHTQKFRGADALLTFLREELTALGIKEDFPEISAINPLGNFDKTERDLLIQINLQLSKLEKILQTICDAITKETRDEEADR